MKNTKGKQMLITDERRNLYRDLDTLSLPADAALKLAALGITTLDELRDHWAYGNRERIIAYLGESPLRFVSAPPERFLATRGVAGAPSNVVNLLDAGRARPLVKRARGVLLSAAERQTAATDVEMPAAALATRRATSATRTVSLVSQFPAVRQQHDRGTCVAFASVAYLEFHLSEAASARAKRHSEQFVYWACKQDDDRPRDEGTFVSTARTVLKERGACLSRTWKYNRLPIANNEGQGPPPAGAKAEALESRWPKAKKLAAKIPDRIQQQLDAQRPVVLSVLTFPSWDFATVADTGEIPMPIPGDKPDGGHAICVVGYELNPRFPGGGAFVFRNSWGTTWAKPQGRFGVGYGTLFFDYVKKYGMEAFV
ncbi:MAG: C1 family peptidase [Planctomycetota bacterium]